MCRFTLAIDQQNVNVQCFSLNISKSGSLRLVGKRQKILRVLPTIVEVQEDGIRKEFQNEDKEICRMSELTQVCEWETEYHVLKSKSSNFKNKSQFDTASCTKGSKQQMNQCSNHNEKQIKTGVTKPSHDDSKFQGFGDFLPRDFVKDFDQNVPAEIGIKNYLEKKREQCRRLNCREEEMRQSNKSKDAEVQSWLHFFG